MKTLHRFTTMLAAVCAMLFTLADRAAAEVQHCAAPMVGACAAAVNYGYAVLRDGFDRLLMWGGMHVALLQAGIINAGAKDLQTILVELKKMQDDYTGIDEKGEPKRMPEDVAAKFEELAGQAKAMQSEAGRKKLIAEFERFGAEIPDPALPGSGGHKDRWGMDPDREVIGYLRLGALATLSEGYDAAMKAGFPRGAQMDLTRVKGLHQGLLPITRKMRAEFEERFDTKALATIGDAVIMPERLAEVVRATEQDVLRLRDVVNVSRTTSPAIEWVKLTSFDRAAGMVAEGAAKPEATAEVETETTAVKTIAVHMPVTEQQLRDVPQLQNIIDVELIYDLRKVEEEEMMYGPGTGQHFRGILAAATGVLAARTVGGDTLIDKIRRAITDVRRSGYSPNAVALDPLDWETVVLQKGSDGHYLYQVFPTSDGTLRIWALNVVETIAAEENAGNPTEERNAVVGDWLRGATLFDYEDASVGVGWINDQYIKNMRTIRAEERAAFAVKRSRAFRKILTQASAS